MSGWTTTSFTTPMLATAAVTAPAAPNGNGWFSSAVTLTLSSNGAAGTITQYSTVSASGPWTTYVSAAPPVFGEGQTTVWYRSTDGVNTETAKSIALNIDTTAPAIVVSGVVDSGVYNVAVNPSWTSSDLRNPTGSSATLNGVAFVSGTQVSADGAYSLVINATNAAGLSSNRTVAFTIDRTPPSGSISLESGAQYTTSQLVTSSNTIAGATLMRFNSNGSWTSWEPYAATKSLGLSAGDGTKTVLAEFQDGAGNLYATSDAIDFDATAPTGSFAINGGAAATNTTAIAANASVTGATQMRYSTNGGSTWTAWEAYAADKSGLTLATGDGTKSVLGEFRDAAGNDLDSHRAGFGRVQDLF
jgi:hypothetical protein